MTLNTYPITWDLNVFFEGGSDSKSLSSLLTELKRSFEQLSIKIEQTSSPTTVVEFRHLLSIIEEYEENGQKLSQASAYVGCLQAQNTKDQRASLIMGEIVSLYAFNETIMSKIEVKLTQIEDSLWKEIVKQDWVNEISYVLNEIREHALEKLPAEQEALISSLSVDGYHSWGQMYDEVVGNIEISYNEKTLSVGQAYNLFSSRENKIRKDIFEKWENAWENQAQYLSKILNHLAGFRLNIYKARGWEDLLKEPLDYNRMSQETLDAMWKAISLNKQPFVDYLKRKAQLLGVEHINWYDQEATISNEESYLPYQEGADFILRHFGQFGQKLESFTKHAFINGWIEAEDRSNKRPGGFCTSFPVNEESRIFMTYSGTPSNVSTLAHELGHAFHTFALRGAHSLNTHYAMNVAETASTFAEMIVADAAVKEAKTKEERIALLENKIQASVAFYMNIHARFLFETRFYEERKNGIVSAKRLCELMEEAQKEAFCGAFEEYHPHFWASKLHFFITEVPFYNFPYTFGYLFSLGIYNRALEDGTNFEEKYMELLKDTGSMTVEDLAKKHLNVDLTKIDFWEEAVKLSIKDVEEFLSLTEIN